MYDQRLQGRSMLKVQRLQEAHVHCPSARELLLQQAHLRTMSKKLEKKMWNKSNRIFSCAMRNGIHEA